MEEKERVALFLCQAKREHSRLAPQELCPPPWGIGRGLHSQDSWSEVCDKDQGSNSLAFFFLLQGFKRVGLLTRLGCVRGWGGVSQVVESSNLDELP